MKLSLRFAQKINFFTKFLLKLTAWGPLALKLLVLDVQTEILPSSRCGRGARIRTRRICVYGDGMRRVVRVFCYFLRVAGVRQVDHESVHTFTEKVLDWWSHNGSKIPEWALATQIVFTFTPSSASCERVFSLLKSMYGHVGHEQHSALMDQVQASLMLKYNERRVG